MEFLTHLTLLLTLRRRAPMQDLPQTITLLFPLRRAKSTGIQAKMSAKRLKSLHTYVYIHTHIHMKISIYLRLHCHTYRLQPAASGLWLHPSLNFGSIKLQETGSPWPSCLQPRCVRLLLLPAPPHALNSPWLLRSHKGLSAADKGLWRMMKSTTYSANATQPSIRASDLGESKLRVQGEVRDKSTRVGWHTQRGLHREFSVVMV